jgi:hypothetical protein
MKTLHLPFHFHRHEGSFLWGRCKDLAHDYRAQSMLTTSILFAMLIILLVMAMQAD